MSHHPTHHVPSCSSGIWPMPLEPQYKELIKVRNPWSHSQVIILSLEHSSPALILYVSLTLRSRFHSEKSVTSTRLMYNNRLCLCCIDNFSTLSFSFLSFPLLCFLLTKYWLDVRIIEFYLWVVFFFLPLFPNILSSFFLSPSFFLLYIVSLGHIRRLEEYWRQRWRIHYCCSFPSRIRRKCEVGTYWYGR